MNRKSAAFLLAFTLSSTGLSKPSWAQQLVKTPPAAKKFSLGAFKLFVLRDSAIAVPNNGSVFGHDAGPAEVGKILTEAGAPGDQITLGDDALLVKTPGRLLLIDTGYGGVLLDSLKLAGFSPEDVTDILITHAHPDHIAGLVDGQHRSRFPRATIRMSAKEWKSMRDGTRTRPIANVIAPQVKAFEPGKAIVPGIIPIAFYGHTPGQVGYEIVSQKDKLIDTADLAHSSILSLARPDWTVAWDTDKALGAKRRREELEQLATTQTMVYAPHFPFPGVGYVERNGSGFKFRPLAPSPEEK